MSNAQIVAIREVVKAFLRYLWFGLIGLVVAYLQAQLTTGHPSEKTIFIVGLIVTLLDRYVHTNKKIDANGLAPGFLQK